MTEFDRDAELTLMAAESAAAEALFGPIPAALRGCLSRITDAHTESPQREFIVFESAMASVFVYERPEDAGDATRFTVELFVDTEVDSSSITPARVRALAAMMVTAAGEAERLAAAGVGTRQ